MRKNGLYFINSMRPDVFRRFCASKKTKRDDVRQSTRARNPQRARDSPHHESRRTARVSARARTHASSNTHTRAHTRTRTRIVVRTFCVMYRDIPITPDSRCSVHSKVTCKRTSFFFDAAVTTSAPREGAWRCADDDGAALSAEVLAMDVRAASMAASGVAEWRDRHVARLN